MKMIRLLLLLLLLSTKIYSQSLTFSSSGQTGTSGTNWFVSGSNPVKIISTNTSNINTSVLQGYINSGVDVIVSSIGNIIIDDNISKTISGSLILKSKGNSISGSGSITLGNNTQLLINSSCVISNNIILSSGTAMIGFAPIEVEFLLVGGGGGGSSGGGGGGGVVYQSASLISGTSYPVTVGAGGQGQKPNTANGSNGGATTFNSITANGGGGGGKTQAGGVSGSSGGGAGADCILAGGSATQGYPGGNGPSTAAGTGASGGGGAGSAGSSGWTQIAYNNYWGLSFQNTMGGNGGNGIVNTITGSSIYYGGGGGGGSNNNNGTQPIARAGQGGLGGGGTGANGDGISGFSGTANTGGGGGGGDWEAALGGNGGSGIAIIRHMEIGSISGGTSSAGSGLAAGYTLHTFTSSGSFTIAAGSLEISGIISGPGNVTYTSNGGTITLSGNNTYSGNTNISGGTLILNTTGTLAARNYNGTISNSGILRFRSSSNHTFSGTFSGSGHLIKETSTSTLKLTGNNTYSGTTTISTGVLQIGDSTSTGTFGTGNIINNGAIIVSRSNDLTLSNLISGSGTLTKELSNTLTLTQNNTYSGNTAVNGGLLVIQNNAPNPTSKTFLGTGKLRIEPMSASFTSAFSNSGWSFNTTLSGLTIGKPNNTSDVTVANSTTIAGSITIYGENININENLNTSSGGVNGDILLKASADINLAATKTITTSGGDVILWANSDNAATNGSIALRSGSSIITGSNSTTGGSIWLGGGSDGANWNGLSVGAGYAVPGTSFIPSNGGSNFASAIYLEQNSLSSFGGNIKIAGDAVATSVAVVTYGNTVSINSGSGTIEIEGQVSSTAAGNRNGIILGLHDVSRLSNVTISSSAPSGDAIKITGIGRGSGDAIGLSGTINITSSGGGNIILNGNALGTGRSIVAGNYYNGILNLYANLGNITLNGNTKAVQVESAITSGSTAGPSKINIGQGGSISSSSSNVTLTGDQIAIASGGIAVNSTGQLVVEPFSTSFSSSLSWPITNFSVATGLSGMRLGKAGNTANITLTSAQTISGPIEVYGGTVAVNQNLTTTLASASILLQSIGAINIASSRIVQSNGGHITLRSNAGGTALSTASSIILNSGASILSQGGNITLGGNFTGAQGTGLYATSSNASAILIDGGTISATGGTIKLYGKCSASYDDGIRMRGTINTSGVGTIELYGEAHGGNNGTDYFGGITFGSSAGSTIETENGNLILNGLLTNTQSNSTGAINFYRNVGSSGQTNHINILSKTGNININADIGSTGAYGIGHSSWGNVYIGSPASGWTATGNIVLSYARLVNAGYNGFKVKTTGAVTYEPTASNFTAAQTFPPNSNYILAESASSLTIGKPSNDADITMGGATSIAGPITVYGGTIAINENLTSSNGSTISLFGNTLTFGTNKTVTSNNGQLIIAPQTESNTIGLGGASGTLQLPASYFSTNFSDGFSNIQIGRNTQTGNISANAFTLRDHLTLLTSGALTLGGKPVLGNNNVILGNAISSITGSNSSFFQTNGSGKMITTLVNNASRIFPVGNTYYNPITITNNMGISDTFSVRVIDSVLGNGDTGRQITTPHVKATWDISKNNANSGSGINMQFSWQSSQEIGGISNFVLNHHNDTIWEIAAGTTGSVSGTTTKTISHTGYTGSFSPFAFGNSVTPLPIELKSFKAECQSDYIQVNWTTASEKNNKLFELYKSDNAINWNVIHTTEGQGNKASETNYQFMDYKKQVAYYRLKDIDFDGIENWSQIIFANCKNELSQIEIYPNPAADYIKVSTEIEDQSILRILTLDGSEVKSLPLISKQILVDIRELTSGVYIIEIKGKSNNKQIKLHKK